MNWNKTLKTYEDGSELNVAGLGVILGIGLASAAAVTAVFAWNDSRRMRKVDEKIAKMNRQVLDATCS